MFPPGALSFLLVPPLPMFCAGSPFINSIHSPFLLEPFLFQSAFPFLQWCRWKVSSFLCPSSLSVPHRHRGRSYLPPPRSQSSDSASLSAPTCSGRHGFVGRVSGARRLLFPAQPLQLGPEGHAWGLPVGMLGGSWLGCNWETPGEERCLRARCHFRNGP